MQPTPSITQIWDHIGLVNVVTITLRKLREQERGHRRPGRVKRLDAALAEAAEVAKPLRVWIGMEFSHTDLDEEIVLEMKHWLKALGIERRKLKNLRWPGAG